jgi:hypothetical protein
LGRDDDKGLGAFRLIGFTWVQKGNKKKANISNISWKAQLQKEKSIRKAVFLESGWCNISHAVDEILETGARSLPCEPKVLAANLVVITKMARLVTSYSFFVLAWVICNAMHLSRAPVFNSKADKSLLGLHSRLSGC